MKKTITLLLLVFAAITTMAQTWQNVGSPGISTGYTYSIELKFDPNGTPYMAYMDYGEGKVQVMRFNGTSWENTGTPASTGDAYNISLAINSTGVPYVAYTDATNAYKTTVKKLNGTTWETVGAPAISIGETYDNSLVFNPADIPYLAYADSGNGVKATVVKFNGTSWENVGLPGFSAGGAQPISLDSDSTGILYVAFTDEANDYKATVMKFNGTSWENVGTPGFTTGEAFSVSLAVDASGMPNIVFRDEANEGKATMMKFNGSTWDYVGSPGFSNYYAEYNSLVFDPSGTPHVAFKESSTRIAVMKFNGNDWENMRAQGIIDIEAGSTAFALDASGTPYVGYTDQNLQSRAGVKKFCADCVPVTQLGSWYCGEYLSSIGEYIYVVEVENAQKYRFRVFDGTNTYTVVRSDDYFRLTMLPTYAYNTNYTVEVAVMVGNRWGNYDAPCTFTSPMVPLTGLRWEDCNSTVATFSTNLQADPVTLADAYRFKVTYNGMSQVVERPLRVFWMGLLPSHNYATTYTVEVAARVNGAWTDYGFPCTVTTPDLPSTQLVSNKCGVTIAALDSSIKAEPVLLAQSYRFRILGNSNTEYVDSEQGFFRISMLNTYSYNKTYTIDVAIKVNDIWENYGPACTVTTPPAVTSLKEKYCNQIVSHLNTPINATPLYGADAYRFKILGGFGEQVIETATPMMKISMLTNPDYFTSYLVMVAARINGQWGEYGSPCGIRAENGISPRMNLAGTSESVELTAYPNPFDSSFTLSLETISEELVSIMAYDITGKMLENRTVSVDELDSVKIGENLASGMYSVIVSQGSFTKTVKMVKK